MAALAFVALCAGQTAAQEGDWREGRQVFQKCKACHSFTEGQHQFGPSLYGIFGREAGTVPDYAYSAEMRAKLVGGLVWTEETMDEFLTKPGAFIPKTKMNFPGLPDAQDRANVIAFVKRRAAK
ncbi:MAG: cytochrome c family protein [Alphaproteobacteria bacterium]